MVGYFWLLVLVSFNRNRVFIIILKILVRANFLYHIIDIFMVLVDIEYLEITVIDLEIMEQVIREIKQWVVVLEMKLK